MKNFILIYFWQNLTLCTIQNSRFDEYPQSSKNNEYLRKNSSCLENSSADMTQAKKLTNFSIDKILQKPATETQNGFSELNESFESVQELVIDEDYDSNQSNQNIYVYNHNECVKSTFSNEQRQNYVEIIENEYPLDLSTHSRRPMNIANTDSILDLSNKNSINLETGNPKTFHSCKNVQNHDEIIEEEYPLDLSTHSRRSMGNSGSVLDLSNKNSINLETGNPKTFRYFKNIQKSSLLDSKDVISLDLYKYFLELVARIFYFQSDLDRFNEYFILSIIKNRESLNNESFEKFLVPLVDNLLKFNENSNNSVFYKSEKEKISGFKRNVARLERDRIYFLAKKERILNNPIEECKITKKLDRIQQKLKFYLKNIEEESKNINFHSISEQVRLIKVGWKHYNICVQTLCLVFSPINKIVKYYNDNLRNIFHQDLIKLDLSFIPQNRKFIDYTKYEQHPHYLVYLIVDLFYSILSTNERGCYGLYLFKINSLKLLHYLNIIFFLSLNKPDTIRAILNDNFSFSKFINCMESAFAKTNIKAINVLYKNFEAIRVNCYINEKQTSLIAPNFYTQINEIEKNLNINLRLFYQIPYELFKLMVKE